MASSGRVPGAALPRAPRVLMYHSISPSTGPDPDFLRVHPAVLDSQLRHLRRRGLRGVSVQEWLTAVDRGAAARLVALTFDDGYRDFVDHAMPVLERHCMTASLYVVTGKLSGVADWVSGGPQLALMSADDVRTVAAAGHEIGGHTSTHPRLGQLEAGRARAEIAGCGRALEEILQRPVEGFAYPYGSFSDEVIRAVQDAGFGYAVATDDHTRPGRFTIARFYVGQRDAGLRLEAKFLRHRIRSLTRASAQ